MWSVWNMQRHVLVSQPTSLGLSSYCVQPCAQYVPSNMSTVFSKHACQCSQLQTAQIQNVMSLKLLSETVCLRLKKPGSILSVLVCVSHVENSLGRFHDNAMITMWKVWVLIPYISTHKQISLCSKAKGSAVPWFKHFAVLVPRQLVTCPSKY